MHIEMLAEDSSGGKLLEILLPKLISEPHTWRIHTYQGIGRIPKNLTGSADPTRRILLEQLPRILRGYGRTPGIDAVVVVLDADSRDCKAFLGELRNLAENCQPAPATVFRLAIEETEAWYLGDREALTEAYPRARLEALGAYEQDSVCGTWELLADALVPGGARSIRDAGWPLPGQVKHEWAERIGPLLEPTRNISPSFQKLCGGIQALLAGAGARSHSAV